MSLSKKMSPNLENGLDHEELAFPLGTSDSTQVLLRQDNAPSTHAPLYVHVDGISQRDRPGLGYMAFSD